jgi:hypothetical protein
MVPNYLESRYGTADAPITIEAAGKRGSVTMASLNVYDVRYLTLRGVRIQASGGDGFHCEKCDHVTIENSIIRGAPRDSGEVGDLVKVNQSQHMAILRSDVSGAGDNAIDFVSVQHGQIVGNRIHDAGDWCAYVKGGSAYVEVIGNDDLRLRHRRIHGRPGHRLPVHDPALAAVRGLRHHHREQLRP